MAKKVGGITIATTAKKPTFKDWILSILKRLGYHKKRGVR